MASVCLFLTDFTHHDHLKVHPCCVNGILSFFGMAEWYSVVCAHVHVRTHTHPPASSLFIPLLTDTYWHVLAVVKSAAVSMGVWVSFQV